MIGAQTLRALVGAGLSSQQILAVVDALEADARPRDRNAAERQRRRRDRLRAEAEAEGVGEFAFDARDDDASPSPDERAASGITPGVTLQVTGAEAVPVTASATPLDEYISNPPEPTLNPEGFAPSVAKPSSPRPARARRLPDDFVMPDDWKDWARAERGWDPAAIATEAANFADYWQARGSGATKRDWRKAWQHWVRTAKRPDGVQRDVRSMTRAERAKAAEDHAARLERIGRPDDAAEIRRRWSTGPPRPPLDCLPPALRSGLDRRRGANGEN